MMWRQDKITSLFDALANYPALPARRERLAARAIAGAVGALVVWAALASVDEAVRADGRVVPSGRTQLAQHLEGGVVEEILAREGQTVERGAVLVRISPEQALSQHGERERTSWALRAKVARLRAEISGEPLRFGQDLTAASPAAVAEETRTYQARAAQLAAEVGVAEADARAKRARLSALRTQESVAARKVETFRKLAGSGALSVGEQLQGEGELAAIRTEAASLPDDVARLDLLAREARERFRARASEELADAAGRLDALDQALRGTEDRVRRVEVVAPARGIVKSLSVTSTGAVVKPGETVAEITPLDDGLTIEARLRPQDVRGVAVGHRARVRLSAYDFTRFGALEGVVVEVSPDAFDDQRTGQSYYRARIKTDRAYLGTEVTPLPVGAGMTATVDIITGSRSVLGYLVAPISRGAALAFRER